MTRYFPPQNGATRRMGEALAMAHPGSRQSDAKRRILRPSDLSSWSPQGEQWGRNLPCRACQGPEPNLESGKRWIPTTPVP